MRTLSVSVSLLVGFLLLLPTATFAQDDAPPETHIVTVTVAHVPFTAIGDFMEVIDEYSVPQSQADPHLISFKIATHAWGNSKKSVWFISEYANLSAIEASGDWGEEWFDENYPEDTPEREEADKAFEEKFLPYFEHSDNILSLNVTRSK